jgi:hypothetical protein
VVARGEAGRLFVQAVVASGGAVVVVAWDGRDDHASIDCYFGSRSAPA